MCRFIVKHKYYFGHHIWVSVLTHTQKVERLWGQNMWKKMIINMQMIRIQSNRAFVSRVASSILPHGTYVTVHVSWNLHITACLFNQCSVYFVQIVENHTSSIRSLNGVTWSALLRVYFHFMKCGSPGRDTTIVICMCKR